MNVLEKILEEIIDDLKEEGIIEDNKRGHRVVEIIRSHMDEAKDTNAPSNASWIPVEEKLPEDGTYLCTLDGELVGEQEPFTGMCGIENGKWDEEGCVIAWKPLPEPYKGE